MYELLIIMAIIGLVLLARDQRDYVTVYQGVESTLSEANQYYWILKHHKIPFKYQIPYNWENFYRFGYKESPVLITVHKQDEIRARQVLWQYRKQKMMMEKNIKKGKN